MHPLIGVEVLFNSSRKNTTMNVGGTNEVGVAKDVRIWAPIHQELLFMISRDGPRFQSSLDLSLSSDQWGKSDVVVSISFKFVQKVIFHR